MKLYKLNPDILLENEGQYFSLSTTDWDGLVNREHLYDFLLGNALDRQLIVDKEKADRLIHTELSAPLGSQEIWASGVTYLRSRQARIEESKDAGGGDFYDRVYEAERPELFFKATAARVAGSGQQVNIRRDSDWDVPEPELTLFLNSKGQIQGYTIGNDMSSRSIEGENPLYLPQAKTYDRSAAVGPCLYVPKAPLSPETTITLEILRDRATIFNDAIAISRMKRGHRELAEYLFRECSFPTGCYLMTGTGIVPPTSFTLRPGDEIRITIDSIGTLVNTVGQAEIDSLKK
jgi:2-dehydro-3-deoxy-D-arabinonate dehydratase